MTTTTKSKPRAARLAIGAVLAGAGAITAIGGAGVLAFTGSDGAVSSGRHDLSTPTTAVVSEVAEIEGANEVASVLGRPEAHLSASSQNDRDVFVGIGPAAEVERYLAGAEIDRVTEFSVKPYSLDKTRRAGGEHPAQPANQDFWIAQSRGPKPDVDWKVRDGSYRLVVMNADGSRGVETSGSIELDVPHLTSVALATLIGGFAALALGIGLMTPRASAMRSQPDRNVDHAISPA